jgi:hypothetical protein
VFSGDMQFHAQWQGTLGLAGNPEAPKRHWATIKALTRRLAEGWSDEYYDLKPAASLRTQLEFQLYGMVQRPLHWSGQEPEDAEQQFVFDSISSTVAKRLFILTQQIILRSGCWTGNAPTRNTARGRRSGGPTSWPPTSTSEALRSRRPQGRTTTASCSRFRKRSPRSRRS